VFGATTWSDIIRTEGAEVIARYTGDWFADGAAVTEHGHGRGRTFYVGTSLDADGLGWILERALRSAGLEGQALSSGVESLVRSDGEHRWRVLLNHSAAPADVTLDAAGVDLLSGQTVAGSISLGPAGVAIVRSPP
jgi:beta-galactosidase